MGLAGLPGAKDLLFRQALYRFCAAGLLYPNAERIAILKNGGQWLADNLCEPWPGPELRDRLRAICGWFSECDDDPTALQAEWIRLFGVSRSGFCFPYQGATVEAQHAGALQAMLQREYAQAGLVLSTAELPDHIGVELEYISFLCGLEIEAVRQASEGGRRQTIERQRRFLTDHLCRWLPGLTRRVRQADGMIFVEICSAAEEITADERRRLDEIVSDLGESRADQWTARVSIP